MALSADTPRTYELGDVNELTVAAGVTIYEGAFVFALKSDGTAVVASPALSTHAFAGIAIQGATAGNKVRLKDRGKVVMPVTGASASSVGLVVAATDDNTLTVSTTSATAPIGYISRHVTSTTCVVEFRATAERDTALS